VGGILVSGTINHYMGGESLEMGNDKRGAPGRFDFQLTAGQERRADKLHRDSIIVDLLSQHAGGNIFAHYPAELQAEFRHQMAKAAGLDGLTEVCYWPYEMSRLGRSDLLREWIQGSGLTCGTYDIAVYDDRDPVLKKWESIVLRYADLPWLRYVTRASEIRQAKRDGVVAFYAHCQPVYPAPRDLKAFDVAYAKGLRSFMLTYNRMDNVGVGCTERVDAGLSSFGVEVVKHCNDLGMIVDVSHCGHLTTLDACRHSRKPVNANHTAARSLSDHARGKTNEALRAIAETGGVIGVVALPIFLSSVTDPTIEHMLDHIDYISNLVGWQHVAIGTDWPMQAPDDVLSKTLGEEAKSIGFREQDRLDVTKRLAGFDDCRDLPNITRGLVKRGYSDEQIQGILGENALRVFEQVCG
jgi:membrane dipeptidase